MRKPPTWLTKPRSYLWGALALALLNVLLFLTTGKPWRITTGFLYWASGILELLGANPSSWYYYSVYDQALSQGETFFYNSYTFLNLSLILGALTSALLSSEFKWKRIKTPKQGAWAFAGGILMGYGTRLSFGCNIGSYFSAIPSFSLHGWIFGLFMFLGAFIGVRLLKRYLLF